MKRGILIKSSKKWWKVKGIQQMISSTNEDSLEFVASTEEVPANCDFFIQSGIKKPSRGDGVNKMYDFIGGTGKPVLIRETPNLRHINDGSSGPPFAQQWLKLCWNSFFLDEGLFPYDTSYDRWSELSKKWNIDLHDWQRRGDAVLFNLQIPGDSALNRLTYNGIDYRDYIVDKIRQARSITDRPIVVRPHPLDAEAKEYIRSKMPDVQFGEGRSLYEDLDRAWCMVTYNSTSCVEATLYGTPTIVLDASAVSTAVSQTKLEQIEDPWEPDRAEWCRRIAFHQWHVCELEDDYVWTLLKRLIWK